MENLLQTLKGFIQLPDLASTNGEGVNQLVVFIHLLMIALFVGWLAYFLYALWRFNGKRNPRGDYQGVKNHASNYIELTVAGIEAVLLIFVAIPVWSRNVDKFPKESEATRIQVVAQQFAWNARYAGPDGEFGEQSMDLVASDNVFGINPADLAGKDDVQVLNEFHVPVDKPVIAYISSKDVIHSFKLLPMRVAQDAIPGMRIPIWFQPTKEGRFQIHCAQLCGNGHAAMANGLLVVESPEAYEKWLTSRSGGAASFE